MSKKVAWEDALKDYTSVKYFPFPVDPGEPYMLTSNPWNYLKTWLSNELKLIKRNTNNRKERLEKSLYFLDLAHSYHLAADKTSLPTRGTLVYYSILNLIKVFLLVEGVDLESEQEHHGLSLKSKDSFKLTVSPFPTDGISIFKEFATRMGSNPTAGDTITLDEMISGIPEIHEMAFNIGKLNSSSGKRIFLPVSIRILTNCGRRDKLQYDLSYEKKSDKLMSTSKFTRGVLNRFLDQGESTEKKKHFISTKIWNYTNTSDSSWRRVYKEIQQELKEMGVAVILTRQGYRYYLNLDKSKQKFTPIVYFVALLFYIGSVARYRPTLYNETLAGEYQAVLNEVMETCPSQFLYYIASLITKKVCAVPMAKIL